MWSVGNPGSDIVRESGILPGGQAFLVRDGVLHRFDSKRVGEQAYPTSSLLAPVPGERAALSLKFRNGTTWYSDGRKIFRHDAVTRAFEVVLNPQCRFDQFDVTPSGDIVLVGTNPIPKLVPGETPGPHELSLSERGIGFLIEIYPPNGERPSRTIDYPTDFWEIVGKVEGLAGFTRTWILGDQILLHNCDTGHLYSLDSVELSLREVDVPWVKVDAIHLDEPELSAMSKAATASGKQVGLQRNGVPQGQIQIMPVGQRIFLAYSEDAANPSVRDRIEAKFRSDGKYFALFRQAPHSSTREEDCWGWAELDLVELKVKVLRRIPKVNLPTPFWADLNGDPVAISAVLREQRKATTMLKANPKSAGNQTESKREPPQNSVAAKDVKQPSRELSSPKQQ